MVMAVASEEPEATRICSHCERDIPSSNIDLHYAHCSRNLEKCKICGDMVPRKHAEEHFTNIHAPVSCSLCSDKIERDILAIHTEEICPRRIMNCEFCEFPLPAVDLADHQEICGNRTELCHLCNRYIRLREIYNHDSKCGGAMHCNTEPSKTMVPTEKENGPKMQPRTAVPTEKENGPKKMQPNKFLSRGLLFTTIAVTGLAVALGCFFYQRRTMSDN